MGRPTPLALNRPQLIFGFPPKALVLIFIGIAVGIITPIPKLLIAALAVVALVVTRLVARDPIGFLIWVRALFQKAQYLPTMRKVFRMEIKP